jgi:hypothetical protein
MLKVETFKVNNRSSVFSTRDRSVISLTRIGSGAVSSRHRNFEIAAVEPLPLNCTPVR